MRTRTRDRARSSGCCCTSTTSTRSTGWDAEDHPQSVLTGRTNDEVKAEPTGCGARICRPAGRDRPDRGGPAGEPGRDRGARRAAGGRDVVACSGASSGSPISTRCCSRAGGARRAVTKRELVRYAAQVAPTVQPYLTQRALNLHRFPGADGRRGSGTRRCPATRPRGCRAGRTRRPSGETRACLVVDEPAALVWAANFGALEWHAWDLAHRQPAREVLRVPFERAEVGGPDQRRRFVDEGGGLRVPAWFSQRVIQSGAWPGSCLCQNALPVGTVREPMHVERAVRQVRDCRSVRSARRSAANSRFVIGAALAPPAGEQRLVEVGDPEVAAEYGPRAACRQRIERR